MSDRKVESSLNRMSGWRNFMVAIFVGMLIVVSLFYLKLSSKRMIPTFFPMVEAMLKINIETMISEILLKPVNPLKRLV